MHWHYTRSAKHVQIRLTKVHAFIQLLYVLQTNLFTFTEPDFVHSFACTYTEVK